jgi:hypothetical protein
MITAALVNLEMVSGEEVALGAVLAGAKQMAIVFFKRIAVTSGGPSSASDFRGSRTPAVRGQ